MTLPVRRADLGPAARGFFTTAHGGTSSPPWAAARPGTDGLNLGDHVGDSATAVAANRSAVDRAAGAPVAWMTQVHGRDVRVLSTDEVTGRGSAGEADALVLVPGRGAGAVGVMVADCVPLLLADHRGRAAAAVHVGRGGLVAGVVGATLEVLRGRGVEPGDLHAHLGPSICGACYEVPARMREEVAAHHPAARATTRDGTPGLDVGAAVVRLLQQAGLRSVRAERDCTYAAPDLFSYRRATHAGDGRTGRTAGVVALGVTDRRVVPARSTPSG